MPTVKELEKEISSLKKSNDIIKKRLDHLESEIGIKPEIEEKETSSKKEKSKSPLGSILIIFGTLLLLAGLTDFIDFEVAIAGTLIAIGGIVIEFNTSKKSKPKKSKKETPTKKTTQNVKKEEIPKKAKKTSFEADIGIKWFARIGILALVIGIGFFIKYAVDNNWISHLTRIIFGAALGIGLIIFGDISSKIKKYHLWGKTLIGGGFAITYFAIYAAYNFPEYREAIGISQTLDVILLMIVAFSAVIFSIKDNSQIIAAESFFLGYITSLMSNDAYLITFIYTLILTISLVVVVSYKKWNLIGAGGILASYGTFLAWKIQTGIPFSYSSLILISYFIAFMLQTFFLSKEKKLVDMNILMILANSFLFFILYYLQIDQHYPDFLGIFTLAVASIYFASYKIYQKLTDHKIILTYLYLSILYITLTIPIQLEGQLVTIIWAIETLLLVGIFLKSRIDALKISFYILSIIVALKTLTYDIVFLNELNLVDILSSTRMISFIVTIICSYSIYALLRKNDTHLPKKEKDIPQLYSWAGLIFTIMILFIELAQDYFIWITVVLSAMIILLKLLSKKRKELVYQILFTSVILSVKVILFDSWKLEGYNPNNPLSSTRIISFGIFILLSYWFYFLLKKQDIKDGKSIAPYYCWISTIALVQLIIQELIEKPYWITITLSLLCLSLMLLSKLKNKEFYYQSIVLSVLIFTKILYFDLSYDTTYRNFFLSTRFFAFLIPIVVFYIISGYLEKNKLINDRGILSLIYSYGGTILSFIVILLEMEELWISVGWSVLALIVLASGFIFRKQYLRIQGMIIFAITIFKVFIYDTRSLEPIYRTISYMVLGILLLLVSFIYSRYKDKLKEIL